MFKIWKTIYKLKINNLKNRIKKKLKNKYYFNLSINIRD